MNGITVKELLNLGGYEDENKTMRPPKELKDIEKAVRHAKDTVRDAIDVWFPGSEDRKYLVTMGKDLQFMLHVLEKMQKGVT